MAVEYGGLDGLNYSLNINQFKTSRSKEKGPINMTYDSWRLQSLIINRIVQANKSIRAD